MCFRDKIQDSPTFLCCKKTPEINQNLNYLYVMNQSVGKKSAHLCTFLEQLVFWTLRGLL